MVEFISYDGSYPSLCLGKNLVLKIDGEVVKFTNSSHKGLYCNLISGGSCGFLDDDYAVDYVDEGPWTIDICPQYAHLKKEIEKVINENIPYGCCGGCI